MPVGQNLYVLSTCGTVVGVVDIFGHIPDSVEPIDLDTRLAEVADHVDTGVVATKTNRASQYVVINPTHESFICASLPG